MPVRPITTDFAREGPDYMWSIFGLWRNELVVVDCYSRAARTARKPPSQMHSAEFRALENVNGTIGHLFNCDLFAMKGSASIAFEAL